MSIRDCRSACLTISVLWAAACAHAGAATPATESARQRDFSRAESRATLDQEVPDSASSVLDIGFNIGYLGEVARFDTALDQVSRDGFRLIRAYEPFTRRQRANDSDIVAELRHITERGLVPYLSLSNFPFSLVPADSINIQRPNALPWSNRRKMLAYTNRYPPDDLDSYAQSLRNLVNALSLAFGPSSLNRWYFEIGNEPDTPRYFWGNATDFRKLYRTALDALVGADSSLRVGGAGFTMDVVAESPRNPGFAELLQPLPGPVQPRFISFHMYDNAPARLHTAAAAERFRRPGIPLVMSEWNVSSRAGRDVNEILESGKFVPHLVDIATLCHRAGVHALLVLSLMDEPSSPGPLLGMFTGQGRPKAAYHYLVFMHNLTKAGYRVANSNGLLELRGGDRTAYLARSGRHELDLAGWVVVDASSKPSGRRAELSPGDWILLRRPTP